MAIPALRPYQTKLKTDIYHAFAHYKRVMAQSATGSGKTVVFADIIRDAHANKRRVLLLVHRKELINQAAEKIFALGIPYGVIAAGYTPAPSQWVQIASVQTAIRRKLPFHFDLIIIDEAHHSTANSYRDIVNQYPNAKILGFTATPCRTDGSGFQEDFDHLVCGPQIMDLIKQGYLVAPKMFISPLKFDLGSVKKTAGDYNEKALAELMDKKHIIGGVIENWKKRAEGKRTLVFAISVEHSKHVVQAYRDGGYTAEHVDGTTPSDERDAIFKRFKSGKTLILSNVGIATEGTDIPAVECVQLLRPTLSLSLYLQMVGRALRLFAGKDIAIVLDHANLVFEHGWPHENRHWTLMGIVKDKKPKQLMCLDTKTQRVYKPNELPEFIENIELIEVPYEESRIAKLRTLYKQAQRAKFKPTYAWYKFVEYLQKQGEIPTIYEIQTAQVLLGLKEGWVFHKKEEFGYNKQQEQKTGSFIYN